MRSPKTSFKLLFALTKPPPPPLPTATSTAVSASAGVHLCSSFQQGGDALGLQWSQDAGAPRTTEVFFDPPSKAQGMKKQGSHGEKPLERKSTNLKHGKKSQNN